MDPHIVWVDLEQSLTTARLRLAMTADDRRGAVQVEEPHPGWICINEWVVHHREATQRRSIHPSVGACAGEGALSGAVVFLTSLDLVRRRAKESERERKWALGFL
jgi:hypothetical protein